MEVQTKAPVRRRVRAAIIDRFNALELSENSILMTFALAIGVLSGLGVVAFYKSIDLAYALFYRLPGEVVSSLPFLAYRPVVTASGVALAWWFMKYVGRGHDGLNVPDVQLAVVRRGGDIPLRPALARTAASAITIGSGGSAGSEGPVVVFGSAIGSLGGRLFGFGPDRMRVLVGAGAGAAISAAFNAPIAGAFFALEEILGSLAVSSFPPVVVASVVAAVISRAVFGNHPAFKIPVEYGYGLAREVFVFFPLLGVVTGAVAALFVRTFSASSRSSSDCRPSVGRCHGSAAHWSAYWSSRRAACSLATDTSLFTSRCSGACHGTSWRCLRSAPSSRPRSR